MKLSKFIADCQAMAKRIGTTNPNIVFAVRVFDPISAEEQYEEYPWVDVTDDWGDETRPDSIGVTLHYGDGSHTLIEW
jgi:hypothetical protein